MKIGEYKQMMSNLTRPGTPEQNKKAEENNKKYLADRKAKTLKEYGLDKPLIVNNGNIQTEKQFTKELPIEEQPGYDVSKDQNLFRRIKMYSSEDLGAEFDKAITAEDEALKKLGRDPMNILQRNNVKKFDNNDPSTYPSNPEQRKKLMAQQKLEVLKKDKPFIKKEKTTTPINIPIPTIDPEIFHRAVSRNVKAPTPEPVQRKVNLEDDPRYRNTIFGSDAYYRRKRGFDE
jgi:hypothetical protein